MVDLTDGTTAGIIFGVIGTIGAICAISFLCLWRRNKARQIPGEQQGLLDNEYDLQQVSQHSSSVQEISQYQHSSFSPSSGFHMKQKGHQNVTDIEQDLLSQESSPVHTAQPNQNAESQNLKTISGDRNIVISGPATGITIHQGVNQNVTGKPEPKQVQVAAREAKEALKIRYTTTGSYVQILPWVDDSKKHIMDIYTKLCLVEQVDERGKNQREETKMHPSRERFSKRQSLFEEMFQSKTRMKSYEEIFNITTRDGNPIKRVVISGLAGIGKTTLIDKIAYDWALGNSEKLNKYKLVFVLKMRSLEQSSDLMDAIFDHLLDKGSVDQSALKKFIDKDPDKVLILLDGFDEFKISTLKTSSFGSILKVLNRKQVTECWVVITSRPPLDKLVNSSLVEKPYTHVRVEGFSDADIQEYVNKFFRNDHKKSSKLIQQIDLSDTLLDLAKSPMLLLLMCLLWDADKTLPDTMTRLYNKALKYIFKRKTTHIKEDAISKILISIGKVAIDQLISRAIKSFAFTEGDFENSAFDAAMNAGVLTSERVIDGLDTYYSIYFMHHTLLEYCAAMYWKSLINTEEFNRILDQVSIGFTESTMLRHPHFPQHDVELNEGPMTTDPPSSHLSQYEHLLRFCCGDSDACTNHILEKVHNSRLALICYFESQSKEPPSENCINSVLSDEIEFPYYNDERKKTFLYFLKRATALSRGKYYFTKVKKLEWVRFHFQRSGKDLVELIKLTNNLQSVNLEFSSLTTANTQKILSSLATPTKLTRLVLSGNNTLGGSVLSLAPQFKKLKCLNELHLSNTSLVAKDVSPIAESMGDTLVFLIVSRNPALGGCASIWGPQLGKMECLQHFYLVNCSLKGKDIEPIAMALSGVSTMVYLDLSRNRGLGGCAEMWALHLKRMRHLKEVNLGHCSLIDKDVEPIALGLSDIQTLVQLDLSYNEALGGQASLWALHLKKMNHLKELELSFCNLTVGDMEPIAKSVSDMPILIRLYLDFNKPLNGCAPSWAHHLKQMTKHLKELRMFGLTDEDKKYINASGLKF